LFITEREERETEMRTGGCYFNDRYADDLGERKRVNKKRKKQRIMDKNKQIEREEERQ
jgi:hypothetical protein